MIRVLVVDDHEMVRRGFVRMLEDEQGIEVVGEAASGEEALAIVEEKVPHVVLLDIRMPGIGGLETTRKMIRIDDSIKIIMVTVCTEEPLPSRLLEAGAVGYLTKNAGFKEMIRAIRVVHSGQTYLSNDLDMDKTLRPQDRSNNILDSLSERELQVLMMIVRCEKVQSISDALNLSPKTVSTYRHRIFEKLNVSSDVALTHMAIRYGLIDTETHYSQ